ncbi:Outer membrane protein A [Serratia symbiotica]|nr:Outer membrane protein A [Serratia symbiotica]
MKKTAIALAVGLGGFATLTQAAPKDNTWYIGDKVGWSQYHDVGFYGNGYPDIISNGLASKNKSGAGVFLGYQTKQYFGLEVGYDWLGRMPYKENMNHAVFKAKGIELAAKFNHLIVDNLEVYTRLGGMFWRADSKGSHARIPRLKNNDTGFAPLAGVGLEYTITKNIRTRLDYQFISNIGDASTVGARPDNTMLSLGIAYYFGQNNVSSPAMFVQAPIFGPKRVTLKSKVLFDFNTSALKAEGKQSLEELYTQLTSMHHKDDSIIALGYTDAVGSDNYNNKLSGKRAESVADFLIFKGVPAKKISAHGMGKANPSSRSNCSYKSGHATKAQIKCLAPDRRVEIKIKGINDVTTQAQD